MHVTFNRRTALYILRAIRSGRTRPHAKRCGLQPADCSPRQRFTRSCFDLERFGLDSEKAMQADLDIAVPRQSTRPKTARVHCTTYSDNALPPRSFIDVGDGVAISCPELIYAEMASVLDMQHLALLGHELCGSFSRDPDNPINNDVAFNARPATSVQKITKFLNEAKWLRSRGKALLALHAVYDNAWSPTESVISTMAGLHPVELGYGLAPCTLNKRVIIPGHLAATDKDSRVPDILFGDTHVGINYDGVVHLDLDSIVNAALELARDPGSMAMQRALDETVRDVRAKAVEDIRRNRDLAAMGYTVFSVTKEDLYEEGGLDRVMAQVYEAIDNETGIGARFMHKVLADESAAAKRQELIWSMLPGDQSAAIVQLERRVKEHYPNWTARAAIGF